jgi:hypothetical protein
MYGFNVRIVTFGWQLALAGMHYPDRLRVDMSQNAPERRAHVLPNAGSRHLEIIAGRHTGREF